jgi:2,4-dienoyl-CoA reductase-like NADH-dependent reductase (Old Yellow Enzyme family)
MLHLFSPLTLGRMRLPNRIALAAAPSGFAAPGGFAGTALAAYYAERASGGSGMLVIEHACALPPADRATPHLGLYDDAHIVGMYTCIAGMHAEGAAALVMIDQPLPLAGLSSGAIAEIGEAFIRAAWRARAAGADGVMLSAADGGPFEQLLSPLQNRRIDRYGSTLDDRVRLLLEVVEGVQQWLGGGFVVGVRLMVEEFAPGGLTLHDARVIAKRLVGAGAAFLEVSTQAGGPMLVARFPGWLVPLAAALKAVVEVPVMVGGLSDDPLLADDTIRESSADIAALSESLQAEPGWPRRAQIVLARRGLGFQQ